MALFWIASLKLLYNREFCRIIVASGLYAETFAKHTAAENLVNPFTCYSENENVSV